MIYYKISTKFHLKRIIIIKIMIWADLESAGLRKTHLKFLTIKITRSFHSLFADGSVSQDYESNFCDSFSHHYIRYFLLLYGCICINRADYLFERRVGEELDRESSESKFDLENFYHKIQ